jgi:glycosyltransferase involved in cell wall biosynthesis
MKVLMVEPIGYSGICVYTAQLSRALAQSGWQVSLVTSRMYDPKAMGPEYPFHRILGGEKRSKSRSLRALDYMASWRRLPKVLKLEKPDLIHFQNSLVPILDLAIILLLRLAGYPVAYTVHDVDRSGLMTRQRWRIAANRLIDRAVYRSVSALIVHTQGSREELQGRYSIPSHRMHRINHGNQAFHLEGVRLPEKSEARKRLGIPEGALVVLFFGDRRPSKGLDLLIRALPEACKRVPDMRLVIAGERRVLDTTDYALLASREGVAELCHFHDGFISKEDVPAFFVASDIVALPYRKIYQSGVVHLAFAFARPVLASRAGGLAETVEDGRTGFFVDDPEDIAGLAEALARASLERDRLAAMGEAARKKEMEEFGWAGIAEKTLEVYRSLLRSP